MHTEIWWGRPHLLGSERGNWKDNIKMDFKETGCGQGRWLILAQYHVQWWALALLVSNLRVLLPQS
jgi:hypothetical protein